MKRRQLTEKSFQPQKEVSFFLRLHRHLPDKICDGSFMFTCFYRKDGKPINIQNDYVDELQKDPDFRQKEKEVLEAVKNRKKLFIPKSGI